MKQKGRVIIVDFYSRDLLIANRETLFAFGDNLARIGYGGQAKACRGQVNAVGIPTKISPTEYLFDCDIDKSRDFIIEAFVKLREHLRAGGNIAWPENGVGTGLARLHITAPLTLQAIEACKNLVFSEAISITHESFKGK